MSRQRRTANQAWPDPASRALARGRRLARARIVFGTVLAAGALWASWALGLLNTRGVALIAGIAVTAAFARRFVSRELAGHVGPFDRAVAARPSVPVSNRLTELERSLDLATVSAGDAHHVLRPMVVDIAGTWLRATHGMELTDRRARELVPRDVWAFASPTAGRPEDPHRRGLTLAELDTLVSSLESLP